MHLAETSIELQQYRHYKEIRNRLWPVRVYVRPKTKSPAKIEYAPVAQETAGETVEQRTRNAIEHAIDMFKRNPGVNKVHIILVAVARCFDLNVINLTGDRRTANFVVPRHIACAISYEITGYSLPEIGRQMGGRDHTTIMHAVRKKESLIKAAIAEINQQ